MIKETEPKKAFKNLKKNIDTSKYLIEELFYKIALAYLYETSYRSNQVDIEEYTSSIKSDASSKQDHSYLLLNYVVDQIINEKIFEKFIIEHFMTISRELGYPDISVKLIEAKFENNPKDIASATQLFDTYVEANNFMKINAISMKISAIPGMEMYSVHSIQSLYMLSKTEGALPSTIDLALMFAKKHFDKIPEGEKIIPKEGQLYIKILNAKNMYAEALGYINLHPEIYSSDFERQREIIRILELQVNKLKSDNKLEELITIQ